MDDVDLFLDDDLGDIAQDKLLELENHAIISTQRPPTATARSIAPPTQRLRQKHNASSLNRGRAANTPWRPPQQRLPAQSQRPSSHSDLEPPSQQQDDNGESIVNLADQPLPGWSQSQVLPQRSDAPNRSRLSRQTSVDEETAAAYAAADEELSVRARPVTGGGTSDMDVTSLQARVAELEAEALRARNAEKQAQKALETKAGEITIVRANLEKQRKDYDRRVTTMQQEHAVQAAKHRAEVEAGRKEREKMQTDNRFLQHDLNQEAERAKRNGTVRPRAVQPERETPRKLRRHPQLGDGFDDSEVTLISPSRSRERPKDVTPRTGSKRKRAAPDSPLPPLSFSKPASILRNESTDSTMPPVLLAPKVVINPEQDRLRFMQIFISYKPLGASVKVLEALIKFSLPSAPDSNLSSKLMDDIATGRLARGESMPLQMCRILIRLCDTCLEEQYYEPHTVLLDLICFTIAAESARKYACLAEDLVPLCLKSMELVTLPVVRASLGRSYNTAAHRAQHAQLASQIDGARVMSLLYQICQACTLSIDRIEAFWRAVDFTNSMLMIHKALPLSRVMVGLDILITSVLDSSFGPINPDPTLQEKQENDGIYRLTFAFFDTPTVPSDEEPYSDAEITEFRIAVLTLFQKMCLSDHNSRMLAGNAHFLGKLIRFVEEQLKRLYASPVSNLQFAEDSDEYVSSVADTHDLVANSINIAIRLLHHLLTKFDEALNLGDKFNVVVGGYHKFLIGMTRIAFAEQHNVCEYGIAEDVVDAAHAILDHWLTPDDGEAIAQAFETPQGTRSASARKARHIMPQSLNSMDTRPG